MTFCIATQFHNRVSILDCHVTAIAPANLRMASYAMNQPWYLEDICAGLAATDIEGVLLNVLRGNCHWIYHFRWELIHEPLLTRITGGTLDTVDGILHLSSLYLHHGDFPRCFQVGSRAVR